MNARCASSAFGTFITGAGDALFPLCSGRCPECGTAGTDRVDCGPPGMERSLIGFPMLTGARHRVPLLKASSVPDIEHVTGDPTVRKSQGDDDGCDGSSQGDEDGWEASTYVQSLLTGSKICRSYEMHGSHDASTMLVRSLMHFCLPMTRICLGLSFGFGRKLRE